MPNQDSKLDDTFSNHLKEYDKIFFDDSLFWLVSFFTLFYYLIFLFIFRSCTVERVSALISLQWAFFFFNFFTRKLLGYKNTTTLSQFWNNPRVKRKMCSSVEGAGTAALYFTTTSLQAKPLRGICSVHPRSRFNKNVGIGKAFF